MTYFLQIRVSWILQITKFQIKFCLRSTLAPKNSLWWPWRSDLRSQPRTASEVGLRSQPRTASNMSKITTFALFGLRWPRRLDLRSPGLSISRSVSNFWHQSRPQNAHIDDTKGYKGCVNLVSELLRFVKALKSSLLSNKRSKSALYWYGVWKSQKKSHSTFYKYQFEHSLAKKSRFWLMLLFPLLNFWIPFSWKAHK